MPELSLNTADRLQEEWEHSGEEDLERCTAILVSLGSIAANTGLDAKDKRVKLMREKAIEILFEGLRGGIFQVKGPLEALRDCEDLSPDQRKEIQSRLEQAYGLVRK